MAVNESLTKFWIIDSGTDDDWIVRDDEIIRADEDDVTQPLLGAKLEDGERASVLTLELGDEIDASSFGQCYSSWLVEAARDVKSVAQDIQENVSP